MNVLQGLTRVVSFMKLNNREFCENGSEQAPIRPAVVLSSWFQSVVGSNDVVLNSFTNDVKGTAVMV